MADEKKLQRYLVRKATNDVFAWNEILATRKDLEEVYAENPKQALQRNTIPDHRNVSLDQIEAMTKEELQIFAKVRLGVQLDMALTKTELQDQVKIAIFQPRAEDAREAFTPTPEQLDRPRARSI